MTSKEPIERQEVAAETPGTSAVIAPPPGQAPPAQRGLPPIRELLRGDLGQIPVFIGLVIIAIYFQIASNGFFFTGQNLTNLVLQIISIAVIGAAAVLVLLIAEIDLSLSAVAFLCAAIMGVLSARAGWPAWAAIAVGVGSGAIIGAINGFLVAVVRVPSFIVTLAGFIGYQGLLSRILEPQTTLPLRDNFIVSIAVFYMPDFWGVGLPILGLLIYAASIVLGRARRQRAGLPVSSTGAMSLQIGAATVIVVGVVIAFEAFRGVPAVALILVAILVIFWLLLRRTAYGRHVYAVGGNPEAARRAGINIVGLRISIFALASALAAVGGILLASREGIARADVSPLLLLNAIAAAVIGGVSLFGGRGSVWAVVLGSLIVGSLINGLSLTGQTAAVQEMVEGIVLLLAVIIDALARRRSVTGLR